MRRTRKINSFEQFAGTMREVEPNLIVVEADKRPERGLFKAVLTSAVGELRDYSYGLAYDVNTNRKPRRYRENLFSVLQSGYGIGEGDKRDKRALSALLAAEVRVESLRTVLPEAEIYVGSGDGSPMPDDVLQRMHEAAESLNVQSPI